MGFLVSEVVVDEPGVGGGVVDEGKRAGLPIVAYHGGRGLSEGEGDSEEDCRMFANVRARDWWKARRIFERSMIALAIEDNELAEELVAELASVHYEYNDREKIKVESKKDMQKRLGDDASPDLADTVIMGLAKTSSTAGALGSMMTGDVDAALGGEDRACATAQQEMFDLW